ncbi:hypothetical protein NWK44_004729 [Salmonella enterica]|nr:hypothetical protein [Salmonella enterica]
MKEIIKLDKSKILKDLELLNKSFPEEDLKRTKENIEKRVPVGIHSFSLSDVRFLNKHFDCVVKVFHSNGRHSYKLYAPKSFIKHLELNYSNIPALERLIRTDPAVALMVCEELGKILKQVNLKNLTVNITPQELS